MMHMTAKQEAVNQQPAKRTYDADKRSRSPMKGRSEYQKEYPGTAGKSRSPIRNPDSLAFGDVNFHQSTVKTAFTDPYAQPGTRETQQRTQGLQLNIKEEGRFGHLFKDKEEHADRYKKPEQGGEAVARNARWVQGKEVKPDLPFNGSTSNKRDFRGHSADKSPQRQTERFDNLGPAKPAQVNARSQYQQKHEAKQPDTLKTSQLHDINKALDRRAEPNARNFDPNQKTTYQREHSRTPDKNATMRSNLISSNLQQLNGGYYHPEQ